MPEKETKIGATLKGVRPEMKRLGITGRDVGEAIQRARSIRKRDNQRNKGEIV